ncbi:hypothetical protein Ahos_1441 [Acidianus hospitalis W1]|uniref:Uncharacterized protein n=1 Tax=Acidianus hospitalis (strain W1) TaxID=933801 RepID=F4B522_ACIHW|nr:hypothetical protein Ahos_1441 [Acidianus hospitalis W1]
MLVVKNVKKILHWPYPFLKLRVKVRNSWYRNFLKEFLFISARIHFDSVYPWRILTFNSATGTPLKGSYTFTHWG